MTLLNKDRNNEVIRTMTIANPNTNSTTAKADHAEKIREIAYNMDLLFPGLYIWIGSMVLKFGGQPPDDSPHRYPGTINSQYGIAIVLPGYRIFTTYQGSYDLSAPRLKLRSYPPGD